MSKSMAQIDRDFKITERVKFCCFCGKTLNWKKTYKGRKGKNKADIVCYKCNTGFIVASRKLEDYYKEE
jgi:hypothetical protein